MNLNCPCKKDSFKIELGKKKKKTFSEKEKTFYCVREIFFGKDFLIKIFKVRLGWEGLGGGSGSGGGGGVEGMSAHFATICLLLMFI